ncbi:MAG: hypothetical protein SXA11_01835, partial [Cyanobacteriota bacterium]|nr:hypothetical protein [Cyanobacteriota bacterium]
ERSPPAPLKKGGARANQSPPYMKTFFLWPPPYQGGREGDPQGDNGGSIRVYLTNSIIAIIGIFDFYFDEMGSISEKAKTFFGA